MDWKLFHYRLTYASLIVLALGIFTSVTFSALSHIFIILPGIFFTYLFFKQRGYSQLSLSFYALALLFVVCVVSVLFNTEIIENPLRHIIKSKYFLLALLAFPAYDYLLNFYIDDKKKKVVIFLFVLSATVASLSGIIALYSQYNYLKFTSACHPRRACGLYGMYMTYGYGMGYFMILLTGMIFSKNIMKKWINIKFLYFAWIVNFIGLYLSYTRGALLGFIIAIPFFYFKNNKKTFLKIVVIVSLIFVSLLTFNKKFRWNFLSATRSESTFVRKGFYKAAFYAFKERPFLGYGYKNFEPHSRKIKERYKIKRYYILGHAHSNYFEHLASTGIIGVIILLFFLFFWSREMYLREDVMAQICFPFVIYLIISGFAQYTLGDGENLFLIMGVYALSQINRID